MSNLNIESIKTAPGASTALLEVLETNETITAIAKDRNVLPAVSDKLKIDFLESEKYVQLANKYVQLANKKTHHTEDPGESKVSEKPIALELPRSMPNEKMQQLNREIANGVVTSSNDSRGWNIWDLIRELGKCLQNLFSVYGAATLAEIDYTFRGYAKSIDAANEARTAGLAAGIAGILGGVLGSGIGIVGTVKSLRLSKSLAKIEAPESDLGRIAADKIKTSMDRWHPLSQHGLIVSQLGESSGKIAGSVYEGNGIIARADADLDSKLTDNMKKSKDSAADTSQALSKSIREIIENAYDTLVQVTRPV